MTFRVTETVNCSTSEFQLTRGRPIEHLLDCWLSSWLGYRTAGLHGAAVVSSAPESARRIARYTALPVALCTSWLATDATLKSFQTCGKNIMATGCVSSTTSASNVLCYDKYAGGCKLDASRNVCKCSCKRQLLLLLLSSSNQKHGHQHHISVEPHSTEFHQQPFSISRGAACGQAAEHVDSNRQHICNCPQRTFH